MTIAAADEETFVLSDEIIDHISNFFPRLDDDADKVAQTCKTLQALINVIGIVLCEIDYPDRFEFIMKNVIISFAQMLKDLPAIRAEVEPEQMSQSIH